MMVETDLNRRIRTADLVVRTKLTASDARIALPANFNELKTIAPTQATLQTISNAGFYGDPLINKTLEYVPDVAYEPLEWNQFTKEGNELLVSWFLKAGEFDVVYYRSVPPLTASSNTNWLVQKHFDVMLYGVLSHIFNFNEEPENFEKYTTLYESKVAALQAEDKKKESAGGYLAGSTASNIAVV